jgi:lysophospholipid acyltransferase (LPLAT)-like uncharacterized protein
MKGSGERGTLSRRSRVILLLGRGALHALARTWRVRILNEDALLSLRRAKKGFVFALWHGHLLPLLWHHRGEGVTVLISEHRDGELVARAAESLGYDLIRGSTTKGAQRALIALGRALSDGREVAITPDGPRGPARKFAPGALVAAQRSDSFVLPVAMSADRSWQLRSWDRFMIPKPFANVTVSYGTPTKVSATSARGAAEESDRFEALLSEAEARINA